MGCPARMEVREFLVAAADIRIERQLRQGPAMPFPFA
jgi:hypothetical protein